MMEEIRPIRPIRLCRQLEHLDGDVVSCEGNIVEQVHAVDGPNRRLYRQYCGPRCTRIPSQILSGQTRRCRVLEGDQSVKIVSRGRAVLVDLEQRIGTVLHKL